MEQAGTQGWHRYKPAHSAHYYKAFTATTVRGLCNGQILPNSVELHQQPAQCGGLVKVCERCRQQLAKSNESANQQ